MCANYVYVPYKLIKRVEIEYGNVCVVTEGAMGEHVYRTSNTLLEIENQLGEIYAKNAARQS